MRQTVGTPPVEIVYTVVVLSTLIVALATEGGCSTIPETYFSLGPKSSAAATTAIAVVITAVLQGGYMTSFSSLLLPFSDVPVHSLL